MRLLKLIERRRLSPLTRKDVVDDGRRSMAHSYKKLAPSPLLTLSVLKLDGSVFEIQVGRSATVAELKQAVEVVFSSSNSKVTSLGAFCLCHVGKKLTNDRAHIRNFGIKDGDQIEFIRHMSISNMPFEKGSKKESAPYKQQLMLTYGSNGHETKVEHGSEDFDNNVSQEDGSGDHPNIDVEEGPMPEFKLPRFWKGWLSYSKVVGAWRF
ncbi:hypothetical protein ACLB2K_066537 [Fragaria x ananassa]